MKHIELKEREQLYLVATDKAIPAKSIDIDHDRVTVHRHYGSPRFYDVNELGVLDLDTDVDTLVINL